MKNHDKNVKTLKRLGTHVHAGISGRLRELTNVFCNGEAAASYTAILCLSQLLY